MSQYTSNRRPKHQADLIENFYEAYRNAYRHSEKDELFRAFFANEEASYETKESIGEAFSTEPVAASWCLSNLTGLSLSRFVGRFITATPKKIDAVAGNSSLTRLDVMIIISKLDIYSPPFRDSYLVERLLSQLPASIFTQELFSDLMEIRDDEEYGIPLKPLLAKARELYDFSDDLPDSWVERIINNQKIIGDA